MSVEQEIIQIILDCKDEEAKQAKQTLEQLNNQAKALDASLKAQTITDQQYRDGLKQIAADASKARDNLQALKDEMRSLAQQGGLATPKLAGADRTAAKAQLGLAGANILQDAVQGGPASTINNFLGLAGNGKIRALAGEFVEAAGGASALGAAIGTVGVIAGGAFLVIDGGLKQAKLGWGDLGEVIDEMTGKSLSGAADEIGKGFHQLYDTVGRLIGGVADYALGWDKATEAVRDHKTELERNVKALKDEIAATEYLGKVQSDAQKEGKRRGELVGTALANLGGDKGIAGVIDDLVTARIGPGDGKKRKVQVPELDDKGKPTGKLTEKEVTEREDMAATLRGIFFGATHNGEQGSMDAVVRMLEGAGLDASKVKEASQGIDAKSTAKEKKADDDEQGRERDAFNRAEKERADKEYREAKERTADSAKGLQERYDQTTATGGTVTRDMVRGKLVAGGATAEDADKQADEVLKKLREGYADRIAKLAGEKGTDQAGAARLIAEDGAKKRKEEADKVERVAEGAARERKEDFERATAGSGIEDRAGRSMVLAAMGGQGYDDLRRDAIGRASAEARMGGMAAEDADRAATEFVDGLLRKMGDSRVEANLGREVKAPESITSGAFTNAVQSAGASEQKTTNELLKGTNSKLDVLIRQPKVAVLGP